MFAIDGRLLPCCDNYAGAVKIWENAHVHARFGDWRGLKDKRDTSKLVRKDGDKVTFRLHLTDLVIWEPNRVYVRCYDSQSSRTFLDRFLPSGVDACRRSGETYIRWGGGYYQPSLSTLIFNYDGRWVLDESTAYRFKTHKVDLSKAARIRATLKPFLDWKKSVDRLKGEASASGDGSHASVLRHSMKSWLEAGRIPEDHYALLGAAGVGDSYVRNCYILGGAVTKCEAPLGSLRPKDEWSQLAAWYFL
jgi:hypothetical protein